MTFNANPTTLPTTLDHVSTPDHGVNAKELSEDLDCQILQDKQVLPEIHRAKITSVRKLAEDYGYGYGIEFTSIDEESQQAINDLVNRLVSSH